MPTGRLPTRFPVALALAIALSVAACSGTEASFDPNFYSAPSPLPDGSPGDLLREEQIASDPDLGTQWRILYRSESLTGDPIAVSGLVYVPPGPAPDGGWPVLSYANGTVGIADDCAPSRDPTPLDERSPSGFVIVATDYEGLGTAGRHPYLVGESEARSVIDAVRAAIAMGSDVGASDRYAVLGYSQGGHAALFANEIADSWAPELELVGTAAGAPAVEIAAWLDALDPSVGDGITAMLLAGIAAADPTVDPTDVLDPDAAEMLPIVDEVCAQDVGASFAERDRPLLAEPLSSVPEIARQIEANTPGRVAGTSPVLLMSGDADEIVPSALIDEAQERMCTLGQDVERIRYPDTNHVEIIGVSLVDALAWLAERLEGEPLGQACP